MWLNGKAIGGFTGYFPFEVVLKNLRKGRNTLVVKVSSMRSRTALTHWRPAAFNGYGTGGCPPTRRTPRWPRSPPA